MDVKRIFQPKIWLLVFALVHTLGMSADLLPVLTDDEAAGTHLGDTVNDSLVDDGDAIEAIKAAYHWCMALDCRGPSSWLVAPSGHAGSHRPN